MRYLRKRQTNSDPITVTPYWIAVIWPFKYKGGTRSYNNNSQIRRYAAEVDDPILIHNDIVAWDYSATKESSVHTMNVDLAVSCVEWINRVRPDDWFAFWAFDNYDDYQKVLDEINARNYNLKDKNKAVIQLNDWRWAPKLVGQIVTMGDNRSISNNGSKTARFSLSVQSFNQLNASVYFDQRYQLLSNDPTTWWNLGATGKKFSDAMAGLAPAQDAILRLKEIFLNWGPSPAISGSGAINKAGKVTSPNLSFVIPDPVANIFGADRDIFGKYSSNISQFGGITYSELLHYWCGVQRYGGRATEETTDPRYAFIPSELKQLEGVNNYQTSDPLKGVSVLAAMNFSGQSFWSILHQYLAQPLNELYTSMRIHTDGRVYPTIVARQIPLSSKGKLEIDVSEAEKARLETMTVYEQREDVMNSLRETFNVGAQIGKGLDNFVNTLTSKVQPKKKVSKSERGKKKDLKVKPEKQPKTATTEEFEDHLAQFNLTNELTFFGDLPTWVIDETEIFSMSLNLTSTNRFNFFRIIPKSPLNDAAQELAKSTALSTPVLDQVCSYRVGPKAIIQDINTIYSFGSYNSQRPFNSRLNAQELGQLFNALMADIYMDNHLKYSGNVHVRGIQETIQPGDNIYIPSRNLTLHIESVLHTGSISGNGEKDFSTALSVSNGVIVDDDTFLYMDFGEVDFGTDSDMD